MDDRTECPYLQAAVKRERELPMGFLSSLYRALSQRLQSTPFGGWLRNFEHYDIGFTMQSDGLIVIEVVFFQIEPENREQWNINQRWRRQIAGLAKQLLERVLQLILKRAKEFEIEKMVVALRYEDHLVRVYRFRVERLESNGRV